MYAHSHQCPNCGAPVAFPSAIAVFAVCAHCRSSVVRRDAQVEIMGQQAQLPPDISPLRVGTRGTFDGRAFTLIGRVRVGYNEGSWNEWCADFGDGTWGWIAEVMGFYAASVEVAPPDDLPGLALLKPSGTPGLHLVNHALAVGREAMPLGGEVRIGDAAYVVRDRKQTTVIASEGTLPFAAVPGRAAISADLSGDGAAFANVEYSVDGARVYLGRMLRFQDLAFEDLRPLPGWTAEAEATPDADAVNCPTCGSAVPLRARGQTMTAVCVGCGTILDSSHEAVQKAGIANLREGVVQPRVPIGRRGTFDGVQYECIGLLVRRDDAGDAWQEYLLFNPFHGFRWLVTYEGHWSFVETLPEPPRKVDAEWVHEGDAFRRFSWTFAKVTYVLGEFYWQVRINERTELEDFVAPPHVLSREKYPDLAEYTWSRGIYLEPSAVEAAFGLESPLREPSGVYLNQPNPHAEKGRSLRRIAPVALVALAAVTLVNLASRDGAPVGTWTFPDAAATTNGVASTAPFEIRGSHPQSLRIEIDSGVANGWVGADIDLVNLGDQSVREVALESSEYSGVEDGESWQEDGRRQSATLSSVPPGRYRLAVEASAEPGQAIPPFTLRATRDVMAWSNFWLGALLLLAYPSYKWIREHAFEKTRWANSGFSAGLSAGDDDDDDDGEGGGFLDSFLSSDD